MNQLLRQVELQTGTAADAAAVDAVMATAFDPRFGEAWTRSQVLGAMAMPGVALLIARVDDQAVGFALTRRVLDEAELLLIAVAPEARRRGVGAALLRAVIAESRGRGVVKLHLEVRAGNPAIALYAAAGFAKVGERRAYYRGRDGRAHDAHSYALAL
jgi:[ribosomal protein S18]-alanine N-acetyltransferase